jgi:hypothetical protein
MSVKLVIDGEGIELVPAKGEASHGYQQYGEPEPYASQGLGESPLIATVFVRPGWKPPKGKKA